MKDCDILEGVNTYYDPLLHIFRLSRTPTPRIYSAVVLCVCVQVDTDAQKMMETLRKDKILRSSMDVRNISFFRIGWNDFDARNPSDEPEYLHRFCTEFCTKVIMRPWHVNKTKDTTRPQG